MQAAMTRPLALLASLPFALLLACASGPGEPSHATVQPRAALETSAPTTVFLETAGMALTPPSSCDDVQAESALDAVYEDIALVRPACESACRVDTCAALLVSADVHAAGYDYRNLGSVRSELAQVCESSVEGCLGVAGVVMAGEDLDSIGLVAELDVSDIPSDENVDEEGAVFEAEADEQRSADEYARLHDACETGDATACFALVDLPMLYYAVEWDQVRYNASMAAFERACALEPRVYCRPLQRLIDDTTHDCGG
jgi:hypothetical protein